MTAGTPARVLAAAVQMNSQDHVSANLASASELIRRAAGRGAELIVLPENFAFLSTSSETAKLAHAETVTLGTPAGPILKTIAALAEECKAWIVLGGMPELGPDEHHIYNTCAVVSPDGQVRAAYRKIHLFDVVTPDGTEYRESRSVAAGTTPTVVETPWGGLGLSVCYDVRFPELYRRLAEQGARLLVVPSAFTLDTGKDHWHVLLRARAIENQAFILAPAQHGRHGEKRLTYGHSLIVDPWGTVLAEAADGVGVAVAELDFERQARVRSILPALTHRRL
ncbi:MAG TPA: carbon-nitrogen hydrolase family protein [Polyangia bacterium]|nr:carbon-nitrogen hydrolase family protein [Polyangia bacterium]